MFYCCLLSTGSKIMWPFLVLIFRSFFCLISNLSKLTAQRYDQLHPDQCQCKSIGVLPQSGRMSKMGRIFEGDIVDKDDLRFLSVLYYQQLKYHLRTGQEFEEKKYDINNYFFHVGCTASLINENNFLLAAHWLELKIFIF